MKEKEIWLGIPLTSRSNLEKKYKVPQKNISLKSQLKEMPPQSELNNYYNMEKTILKS